MCCERYLMKKLLILTSLLALSAGCANCATTALPYETPGNIQPTVGDTASQEFLYNQGFSDEVYRLYGLRSGKNVLTPIPVVEKRTNPIVTGVKKVGWKFIETIDPTVVDKHYGEHSIKYRGVTVDDL